MSKLLPIMMLLANGAQIAGLDPAEIREGRVPMTIEATGTVDLKAAENSTDGSKLRKFKLLAYNGGTMNFWWSEDPVVVDISGLNHLDKSRPILRDHRQDKIVGHSTKIAAGSTIDIEGVVSGGSSATATEVVELADNGFPWQASIGVLIKSIEYIEAGTEVTVNGQTFMGPVAVVRTGDFKETSFVALGADDETTAAMVAAAAQSTVKPKENTMNPKFKKWLKAQGWSDEQIAELEAKGTSDAMYKTLEAGFNASGEGGTATGGDPTPPPAGTSNIQQVRLDAAAETDRINGIRRLCATSTAPQDEIAKIEATAIREGQSLEAAELALMRAERPSSPMINTGIAANGPRVIEAAVSQALNLPNTEKDYQDKELQAAHDCFRGGIGLQQLLLEAAWANGYVGRQFKGYEKDVLKAGFSGTAISGILSNIANKSILEPFQATEQTWRQVGSIGRVSDFKTTTRYRLTADMTYDKVGPTGEIKQGSVGEESYTAKAETYAKGVVLTRQDIINDDLGALQALPRLLARGAGLKINSVFWTVFKALGFWSTTNGNYFDGADSALSMTSLSKAIKLFRDQTDAKKGAARSKGDKLGLIPWRLLVPTALEGTAISLFTGSEIRDTTANKETVTNNIHRGRFEPLVSSYLDASDREWLLLGNPADAPIIETSFLDGREAPILEDAEADFSTLGIQMRAVHDFGVDAQDFRGAVKSKGEA